MKEVLTKWYRRYLSEEEAVVLLVLLASAFGVMLAFGDILAPVFVAVILAYLMPVSKKHHRAHETSIFITYAD